VVVLGEDAATPCPPRTPATEQGGRERERAVEGLALAEEGEAADGEFDGDDPNHPEGDWPVLETGVAHLLVVM